MTENHNLCGTFENTVPDQHSQPDTDINTLDNTHNVHYFKALFSVV